jgi:hypothetical protein
MAPGSRVSHHGLQQLRSGELGNYAEDLRHPWNQAAGQYVYRFRSGQDQAQGPFDPQGAELTIPGRLGQFTQVRKSEVFYDEANGHLFRGALRFRVGFRNARPNDR